MESQKTLPLWHEAWLKKQISQLKKKGTVDEYHNEFVEFVATLQAECSTGPDLSSEHVSWFINGLMYPKIDFRSLEEGNSQAQSAGLEFPMFEESDEEDSKAWLTKCEKLFVKYRISETEQLWQQSICEETQAHGTFITS
ncbi:hypothetical protein Droror1_Dr00018267 [Drosera rotundifolia]